MQAMLASLQIASRSGIMWAVPRARSSVGQSARFTSVRFGGSSPLAPTQYFHCPHGYPYLGIRVDSGSLGEEPDRPETRRVFDPNLAPGESRSPPSRRAPEREGGPSRLGINCAHFAGGEICTPGRRGLALGAAAKQGMNRTGVSLRAARAPLVAGGALLPLAVGVQVDRRHVVAGAGLVAQVEILPEVVVELVLRRNEGEA